MASKRQLARNAVVRTVTAARAWPQKRGLQDDAHLTRNEAKKLFGRKRFFIPMTVAAAVERLASQA